MVMRNRNVTLREDQLDQIERLVNKGEEFSSFSHALRRIIDWYLEDRKETH